MNILYIFSGTRKDKTRGRIHVDYPDTQLYGQNHLVKFGMNAEYREFKDQYPIIGFFSKIIGFRGRHSLMFFLARHYDVVFGISVLYMLIWKKFIRTETKFIIFNSVLSRLLNVHKQSSIKFKILVWILREVDGIVFLAQIDLKNVASRLPFLKEKLFIVHMGVDKDYYKFICHGREDFLLSVGRDDARDYKTVIDVAKKMPMEKFHLVCLPRNIQHIQDIPPNVHIHVNISINELQDFYGKAKALLLITHKDTYSEGSDSSGPTVLLEAMASGLPIIASKKEYLNDYVEHEKDVLLVDFYDSDAIVNGIRTISKGDMGLNMAKNARLKVDTSLNTEEMAHKLARVFKIIHEK